MHNNADQVEHGPRMEYLVGCFGSNQCHVPHNSCVGKIFQLPWVLGLFASRFSYSHFSSYLNLTSYF